MGARDVTAAPCWSPCNLPPYTTNPYSGTVDSYEDTLRIPSIRVDTIFTISSPRAFCPDVKTEQCLTTGPRHTGVILRSSSPPSTALSLWKKAWEEVFNIHY